MKLLSTIALCFIAVTCFSQNDPELSKRLNAFMDHTSKKDISKIMDYTYPKLFTLVPREKMEEMMKGLFNSEEITVSMDSLKVDSVYEVFKINEGSYAKIMYSMRMIMKLKPEEGVSKEKQAETNEMMFDIMKAQYPGDRVSMDSNGVLYIYTRKPMVAIRDEYAKEWCFMNINEKDPLTKALLDDKILKKLATYK